MQDESELGATVYDRRTGPVKAAHIRIPEKSHET